MTKYASASQRLIRMRKSFEKDKSVLADDYMYFTMPDAQAKPRESIHPNKAAHKSAEQTERRSQERNETQSSGRTDD